MTVLERKIALMQDHEDDEPGVDPDFMWPMSASAC